MLIDSGWDRSPSHENPAIVETAFCLSDTFIIPAYKNPEQLSGLRLHNIGVPLINSLNQKRDWCYNHARHMD